MIVLDVEASGVNYEKHSIISVGALDLDNSGNRFYEESRIWDGAHISEEASAIHGMSDEELTDPTKQTEAELVQKFMAWSENIADRTFAGQNVSFDRDFLRAASERAGLNWSFAHRTVDTHTLGWMHIVKAGGTPKIDPKHHRSAMNLDFMLNYVGIPDEPEPHNALTGALSHAEVISRLLYDKKMLPEFEQFDIPWKE